MSELNIGKVIIDQTKTSQVVVNYADTSKPDTSTITSNRSQMTATVESIATAFEASKTYYFDENGNPVTTNQGYGTLGTTDSNGVLTVAHSIPTSGVVLTALQITNASTASAPANINPVQVEFLGDNIIFAFHTNSDKISMLGTDYATGVDATFAYATFVVSMTKSHKLNWYKILPKQGRVFLYGGASDQAFTVNNGYIYTYFMYLGGVYRRTDCVKIDPADGSTIDSLACTPVSNVACGMSIGSYGSTIHIFGTYEQSGYNVGKATRWSIANDFSSQTVQTYGSDSSSNFFRSGFIDSAGRCFQDQQSLRISAVSLTDGNTYKEASYQYIYTGRGATSPDRILFTNKNSNNEAFEMRKIDVAIDNASYFSSQFREVYNADDDFTTLGGIYFNGTDFKALINDGSKFIIRTIADSDTYTQVGSDVDVIPNNIIAGIRSNRIIEDATHYVLCGTINGTMESGFIQGDASKYDGFIMLIEK